MTSDVVPSSAIRSAIDAVLERAMSEWRSDTRDGGAVILVATLDETHLRIRTSASTARHRAAALAADGWTVELRDLTDAPIVPTADGGRIAAFDGLLDRSDGEPSITDDDLPPLPDVGIDRLRDTA
ncbi:MAG: hypothetical protein ACXVPX_04605 [Actinomycetota bacterium]